MTKREAIRQTRQSDVLQALGFTTDEADTLRRISLTLHRWYEQECGDSNQYGDWAIERDNNGDSPPYLVHHRYAHDGTGRATETRTRIPDRERGAMKRLRAIIDARNARIADSKTVCPNCQQWRHGGNAGDCVNECIRRGFAPSQALTYYLQTDPRGVPLYIIRPGDVPDGADVSAYYSRGICVY